VDAAKNLPFPLIPKHALLAFFSHTKEQKESLETFDVSSGNPKGVEESSTAIVKTGAHLNSAIIWASLGVGLTYEKVIQMIR